MTDFVMWDLVSASKQSSNFTWMRDRIYSRLDYFFATASLVSATKSFYTKIILSFSNTTDHGSQQQLSCDCA